MVTIKVHRTQHGIGQGGFHSQSICWNPDANGEEGRFDFVFDCGVEDNHERLKWAINHYRPKQTIAAPSAPRIIDAFFISHFHSDHLSGIEKLCNANTVKRIFAPLLTDDEILCIVAESSWWLADASNGQLEVFLRQIHNLKTQAALFEIPTTYLDPERDQDLNIDFGITDVSWTQGAIQINPRSLAKRQSAIWEIRTWSYRDSDTKLAKQVADQLKLLTGCPASISSTDPCSYNDAQWLINNIKEIQKIYAEAILGGALPEKGKPGTYQNITSLCVYSGPASFNYLGEARRYYLIHPQYPRSRTFDDRLGWLGSGDAEFGKPSVWKDFCSKPLFLKRLELVGTVQIPHHGSANKNYYRDLIRHRETIAVISCSSNNTYNHPGEAVMNDLLEAGALPVVVTEATHPGFHEYVELYWPFGQP